MLKQKNAVNVLNFMVIFLLNIKIWKLSNFILNFIKNNKISKILININQFIQFSDLSFNADNNLS